MVGGASVVEAAAEDKAAAKDGAVEVDVREGSTTNGAMHKVMLNMS